MLPSQTFCIPSVWSVNIDIVLLTAIGHTELILRATCNTWVELAACIACILAQLHAVISITEIHIINFTWATYFGRRPSDCETVVKCRLGERLHGEEHHGRDQDVDVEARQLHGESVSSVRYRNKSRPFITCDKHLQWMTDVRI
jgi:hypothetical protein